jgi:hypothetical protein
MGSIRTVQGLRKNRRLRPFDSWRGFNTPPNRRFGLCGGVVDFRFLVLTVIFVSAPLYGENLPPPAHPLNVGTELRNLAGILERTGMGNAEKGDALARIARLQELLGNYEAAAEAWMDAAGTDPEKKDRFLVRAGRCFTLMGEWEKAENAIGPVLLTSRDGAASLEARYLGARIAAFRTGDVSSLGSLPEDPGFSGMKPALYYTLWRLTGNESWKTRLLAEFPRSPEGRIVSNGGNMGARVTALWLLFPGGADPGPPAAEPRRNNPGLPSPVRSAPEPDGGGRLLQTGLFGREPNAIAMAERLRAAGFLPLIVKRTVNGSDYWAVQVSPDGDINGTIMRLKDAGFESFPVSRQAPAAAPSGR